MLNDTPTDFPLHSSHIAPVWSRKGPISSALLAIIGLGMPQYVTAEEADVISPADASAPPSEPTVVATPANPANNDVIVISAQRVPSLSGDTTQQVSVIDYDHLQRYADFFMPMQAVDHLPGVFSVNGIGGGLSGTTVFQIRGGSNDQTQFTIDGIPFNDASGLGGQINFNTLPSSPMQRVEVLKGSQPIFGTRAVSGVVNIQSRQPTKELSYGGSIAGGSFDQTMVQGFASGPINESFGFAIDANFYDTVGISAQTSAGIDGGPNPHAAPGDYLDHERDGFKRRDATGRIVYQSDYGQWYANSFVIETDYEYDRGTNPDDVGGVNESVIYRFGVGGEIQPQDGLEILADAAITNTTSEFDRSGDENKGRDSYVSVRAHYEVNDYFSLIAGLDNLNQQAERGGFFAFDDEHNLFGSHVQALYRSDHLHADFTGRFENHSEEGDIFTWRIGVSLEDLTDHTRFFGSIATGFQAPSLFQLHAANFGNPDLESQENISYDLGHETDLTDNLTLKNTWFRIEYTDLISFQNGYVNLSGDSFSTGIESSLIWQVPTQHFTAELHHTWLDAEDDDGNRPDYKPGHTVSALASVDFPEYRMWLSGTVDFTSRYDTFQGSVDRRTLVGVVLGWKANENVSTWIKVRNLFDEIYQTNVQRGPFGNTSYSGEPINIIVGAAATF